MEKPHEFSTGKMDFLNHEADQLNSLVKSGEISAKEAAEFERWDLVAPKENYEILEVPTTISRGAFWNVLKTGKFEPSAKEEIENLVDSQLAKYPPMALLSDMEREQIRAIFLKEITEDNSADIRQNRLAKDPVAFINLNESSLSEEEIKFVIHDTIMPMCPYIMIDLKKSPIKPHDPKDYYTEPEKYPWLKENRERFTSKDYTWITKETVKDFFRYRDFIIAHHLGPLTRSQKINIFTNLEIVSHLETYERGLTNSDLTQQGSRSLEEYGLKNFQEIIERVKNRTHKSSIKIMDIGGLAGKALFEAKQLDPSAETYNLTVHEEIGNLPVDHFLLCPAEHMPKDLEEQMDLIISNMSFLYHTFPDLSLRNTILALSIGGETIIRFSGERCPTRFEDPEDFTTRILELFAWLKKLKEKGILEIDLPPRDIIERIAEPSLACTIKAVKKKHITNKDLDLN